MFQDSDSDFSLVPLLPEMKADGDNFCLCDYKLCTCSTGSPALPVPLVLVPWVSPLVAAASQVVQLIVSN